jgi:hypothetical protein
LKVPPFRILFKGFVTPNPLMSIAFCLHSADSPKAPESFGDSRPERFSQSKARVCIFQCYTTLRVRALAERPIA